MRDDALRVIAPIVQMSRVILDSAEGDTDEAPAVVPQEEAPLLGAFRIVQFMCNLRMEQEQVKEVQSAVFDDEPVPRRRARDVVQQRNNDRADLRSTFSSLGLGHLPSITTDNEGAALASQRPLLVEALDRLIEDVARDELTAEGTGYLLGNTGLPCISASLLPALSSIAEQANRTPNLETINGAGIAEQLKHFAARHAVQCA